MTECTAYGFLMDCFDFCTEVSDAATTAGDHAFADEADRLGRRCLIRARDGFEPWTTEGSRRRGIASLLADLVRFQAEVAHREGLTDDRGMCVVESWYKVSRSIVEMVVTGFLNAEALGE
jgi:hypothetical protein